jgi:hypothetical protein
MRLFIGLFPWVTTIDELASLMPPMGEISASFFFPQSAFA